MTSATVAEDSGSISVTVKVLSGTLSAPVRVAFSTLSRTAIGEMYICTVIPDIIALLNINDFT